MNTFKLAWCTALIGAALVGGLPARAQVKYFDRPPTADELRQALIRPSAPLAVTAPAADPAGMGDPGERPGRRTRGIKWDAPATADAQQESVTKADPAQVTRPAQQGAQPQLGATQAGAGAGGPAAAVPINFDLGSARVAPGSMPYVDVIAQVLQSNPGIKLVIEGHTDASGPYSKNMMLSWDRAYTVFKLLVERYGVDPARLQPVGRGPLEPMPGLSPSDGQNRRVQVRVSG